MATACRRRCNKSSVQDLYWLFFQAHIKSIIGHKESKKHSELVKARCSTQQPSIAQSMVPQVQDPTRVAELKVAIYISGHSSNLSLDHLGELLPHLDKKSVCLKGFKLHRTKCGRLQRNVIAPSFAKYLRNDIGENHFSLTVDESTNEANISCLSLRFATLV